jgi:hypothetical protein
VTSSENALNRGHNSTFDNLSARIGSKEKKFKAWCSEKRHYFIFERDQPAKKKRKKLSKYNRD